MRVSEAVIWKLMVVLTQELLRWWWMREPMSWSRGQRFLESVETWQQRWTDCEPASNSQECTCHKSCDKQRSHDANRHDMIGLGRTGANMARRLLLRGQRCVVFGRSPRVVGELVQ